MPSLLDEGIFLASQGMNEARPSPKAQVTRAAYALRAATRTTPHGVWCAVATAHIEGRDTVLRLGNGHRPVTSPSPAWLLGLADSLLDTPGVLSALTVASSNLLVRRAGRFEVEHPGPSGAAQLGSVAANELTRFVLDSCATGTPVPDLVRAIGARYRQAPQAAAEEAVRAMIRTGLLVTDLLPEDLRACPLDHLAGKVPADAPVHPQLVRLAALLREADAQPPGARGRLERLRDARDLADQLHPAEQPLTVDTIADADLQLPMSVGTTAALTATVLWRIGHRSAPLRPWTDVFTQTYGRHRLVPLLEAVDPALGIGPPGPEDAIAARTTLDERRARTLAVLLGNALMTGDGNVELTDDLVDQLDAGPGTPPRTAEIQLHLAEQADGSHTLTVGRHASQDAGSAAGRFIRWLPDLAASRSHDGDGPLIAEIVCRPLTAKTAALVVETGACPHRIPVGVPARTGDLALDDLAIVSTGQDLQLWSTRHQRQVLPVLLSRITRDLLPPAAQLLYLLGHADERPWHAWSWGPMAAHLPYTPQVRYRGVVLAPRRWTLPENLVHAAANQAAWDKELAAWLDQAIPPVPQRIVAEESDRHLPLDLDVADHRAILRRSVARGARHVTQPPADQRTDAPVHGPLGRHRLELVVALHRCASPATTALDTRTARRSRAADAAHDWLSAAVPVPWSQQTAALRQLPKTPATKFFWLRYHTAALGPHLRLRYHAHPQAFPELRQQLDAWATTLAEQGLARGEVHYEPYIRETQRYGGPTAIAAAETVFTTDSALALALLDRLGHDTDGLLVFAAHSAAAIGRTARVPASTRVSALTPADRHRRDHLRPRSRTTTVPSWLSAAWQERHTALNDHVAQLPANLAGPVASDLIHLHCNRLLGPLPDVERIVRSLAADLRHTHG